MAYRFDQESISKYEITPEGFLRCEATIARTGVQTYRNADGSMRKEFRPPEEVSKADSLSSFRLKPVTIEHPPILLDSSNAKAYSVGSLGEKVWFDSGKGFVRTQICVIDQGAINLAQNGEKSEVSCGYTCDIEWTSGTYNGERYDCIQRNIKGNHLALTSKGRAGADVRLHLDSTEIDIAWRVDSLGERQNMTLLRLDGIEYDVPDAVAEALAKARRDAARYKEDAEEGGGEDTKKLKARIAELEEELEEKDEAIDAMAEEKREACDSLEFERGRVAQLQAEAGSRGDSDDEYGSIETEVQSRVDAWEVSKSYLHPQTKFDASLTAIDIKRLAVQNLNPSLNLEGRDDSYIEACFDTLTALKKPDHTGNLKQTLDSSNSRYVSRGDAESIRQRQMEESKNLWKTYSPK